MPLLEAPELLEDEFEFEELELLDELELLELDELDELLAFEFALVEVVVLLAPAAAFEAPLFAEVEAEVVSPVEGLVVAAAVGVALVDPVLPASPLLAFGSVESEATSEVWLAAWARPT